MPHLITESVRSLLRSAEFRPLLVEELGWDHYRGRLRIDIGGATYILTGLAEKRGVVIYEFASPLTNISLFLLGTIGSYRFGNGLGASPAERVQHASINFIVHSQAML